MNLEAFTIKAQEALQAAQGLALEKSHQELLPEHLLSALLSQSDGVATPILERAGVDVAGLQRQLGYVLDKLPSVGDSSGQVYLSTRMNGALQNARKEARDLKDEYVSVEHLVLALAKEAGADRAKLLAAIKEQRGSQKVDSPGAESKYRTLEKFTTDLTALAEKG